jgi:hypothetical protein
MFSKLSKILFRYVEIREINQVRGKRKGLETIEFGGLAPFINVWAMNFFFVFSILTQVQNWYMNREGLKKDKSF